jgi:hypothetical protein
VSSGFIDEFIVGLHDSFPIFTIGNTVHVRKTERTGQPIASSKGVTKGVYAHGKVRHSAGPMLVKE